jgi:hypothetical protein
MQLPWVLLLSSLSPSSFIVQYPETQPLEKFIHHPNFPSNSICPTFLNSTFALATCYQRHAIAAKENKIWNPSTKGQNKILPRSPLAAIVRYWKALKYLL